MDVFDREESRRVDRDAQERLLLPGDLLMENAGGHVARECVRLSQEHGRPRVVVLAGPGNNGGDGFVAARHLLDEVETVQVVLVGDPKQLKGGALANYNRLSALSLQIVLASDISVVKQALSMDPAPIVVDALLGTGIDRPVRGLMAEVIGCVNGSGHPVVAVDLPSGLDCDSGEILGTAIQAEITVTFVAAKKGFQSASGPQTCGKVHVVPIGFPTNWLPSD